MSEHTSRQRLATFMGRQSRNIFPIAESFVGSWTRSFPAAREFVKLETKTERFEFGAIVAEFCKQAQAGRFDGTRLAALGSKLRSAGFSGGHGAAAKGAFLNACSEHAGLDWTPEIERDFAQVADRFLGAIGATVSEHRSMSLAA